MRFSCCLATVFRVSLEICHIVFALESTEWKITTWNLNFQLALTSNPHWFFFFEMQKAFHVNLSRHACLSDRTGDLDSVNSVETACQSHLSCFTGSDFDLCMALFFKSLVIIQSTGVFCIKPRPPDWKHWPHENNLNELWNSVTDAIFIAKLSQELFNAAWLFVIRLDNQMT